MNLYSPRTALIVLTAALMLSAPSIGLAQASDRAAVATTPHFAFYSDFANEPQ